MSESPPRVDGFLAAVLPDPVVDHKHCPLPNAGSPHHHDNASQSTAEFPPYVDDLSSHDTWSGGTLHGDHDLRKSTELSNPSPVLLEDANVSPERRPSLRDHRNSIHNARCSNGSLNNILPDRRKPSPGLNGYTAGLAPLRISTDLVPRSVTIHRPSSRQSRLLNPEALAERRKTLRQTRFLEDCEFDDVGAFRASQWDLGYRNLETARFETRFIELLGPGEDATEDLVQCRLRHASLLSPPDYVALSYNWGDTRAEASVVLNDVLVPVGANLEAALRELRRRGERLVWVDCLSINQSDSSERSFHLLRSGQIYARATKVVAWLGPSAEGSDAAMGFLQQFDISRHANASRAKSRCKSRTNGHIADDELSPDEQPPNGRPKSCNRMSPVNRAYRLSLPQSMSHFSVFDALERLFQRPYFERTWILMELAVGTNVEFLCGGDSASLEAAEEYIRLMRGPDSFSRTPESLRTLLHFRTREAESHVGEARMSLLSALIASRSSIATDARDKIYALLPLTRDAADLVPTPNYVESAETALVSLAANMIALHSQTAIMLLACRASVEGWSLPTWTPNWSSLRHDIVPSWLTASLAQRREIGRYPPASFRNSGRILNIPAIRLEQILSMSGQRQSLSPVLQNKITRLHRSRLRDILVSLWEALTDLCPSDSALLEETRGASDELKIFALRAFFDSAAPRSSRALEIADLLYGAHRVQDWVDEYCDTASSSTSIPSSTRRAIRSMAVYTILKVAVRSMSDYKMKIAICGDPYSTPSSPPREDEDNSDGDKPRSATAGADGDVREPVLSFRVVYRRAHVGDWLWRVRNCGIPVILRGAPSYGSYGNGHCPSSSKYSVIGEVVLRDVDDGERHWTEGTGWVEEDFDEESWENIDLI